MISIRRNVFETNSSSTHSITITKWEKPKEFFIPRNLSTTYEVEEYGDVDFSDNYYLSDVHNGEINKLRFIINMIASVYEFCRWRPEFDSNKRNDKEYVKYSFNKLVNEELFVWLKEVVKEETGTEIEYVQPKNTWYPFFETTYSEGEEIETLLHIEEDGDSYNESKFKQRIKEIIFNNDIIIENENRPYGME